MTITNVRQGLQVAKKNRTPGGQRWTVPGIMGGNAVPGWEDQQGSIVRRIVLFLFMIPIQRVDTTLADKLLQEMPSLLLKCNRAYLHAVEVVGTRSIWDVLPPYFHANRNNMAAVVNSMHGFLASDDVVIRSDLFCQLSDIHKGWQQWVKDQNISPRPRWTADLYTGPIQSRGLRLVKDRRAYRGTRPKVAVQFVEGVDLAANVADDEGDENDPCAANGQL